MEWIEISSISGSCAVDAIATIMGNFILCYDVYTWNGLTIRWHWSIMLSHNGQMATSSEPPTPSYCWCLFCMLFGWTSNAVQRWCLFIHITWLAYSLMGNSIAGHLWGKFDNFRHHFILKHQHFQLSKRMDTECGGALRLVVWIGFDFPISVELLYRLQIHNRTPILHAPSFGHESMLSTWRRNEGNFWFPDDVTTSLI